MGFYNPYNLHFTMVTVKEARQERLMEWSGVPPSKTEGVLGKIFLLRNALHPCSTSGASSDCGGEKMKESRHTDRQKSWDRVALFSDGELAASQKLNSLIIIQLGREAQFLCTD